MCLQIKHPAHGPPQAGWVSPCGHDGGLRGPPPVGSVDLQDQALLLLGIFPGGQGSPGGVFKDFPHTLVRLCGALEVLERTDLLADILGLCVH
jgi:hypothetical protein